MTYTMIWEPHGVVKRFSGFVSGPEFVRSFIDVTASSRFDDLHFIVNDFSEADDHGINRDTFEQIVALRHGASLTRNQIRTVLVATTSRFASIADAVNAQLPTGVPRTEVFATLASAREWLAAQPPLPSGRRVHDKR